MRFGYDFSEKNDGFPEKKSFEHLKVEEKDCIVPRVSLTKGRGTDSKN